MKHDHKNHGHGDCCEPVEITKPSRWTTAGLATLHCLTGCVIGETAGLMIGVTIGLHPYATMALSTVLAYITGFLLAVFPLMRRTNLDFRGALRAIWLGEAVSIGVMEIAMNTVDYHMGGMQTGTIMNPLFWQALGVAVLAGYIAAFPINAWLISKELKRCH